MPNSKHRKKHETKVNQFKQQTKQKMNQNQQTGPQMPEVRNVPTWTNDAKIEITGYEFEAIVNGLTNIQLAQQATQAVLSRNVVSGVIGMEFEKLNPATLSYEPMTAEEKAPYIEDFNKTIAAIKNPTKQAVNLAEPTPQLVSQTGEALNSADLAKEEVPVLVEPAGAKVVKMGSKK